MKLTRIGMTLMGIGILNILALIFAFPWIARAPYSINVLIRISPYFFFALGLLFLTIAHFRNGEQK